MPKQQLFEQFASIAKALSHGNRLLLIDYLSQAERHVEDLAQLTGLSVANTSQHLLVLRRVGLVSSVKRGLKVYYSIKGDSVNHLMQSLRTVGENHLSDVEQLIDRYFNSRDSLEALSREVLLAKVEQGLVLVLDIRPEAEYASGHIPGAVNVPPETLEARLEHVSMSLPIVAYCRGPHCVYAYDAVVKLREKGYTAHRLEDGFPEWKSADMPVETTPISSVL